MAQFRLLNCTWVGTTFRWAGELIDDTTEDKTPIVAAGGQLYPQTSPNVAIVNAAAQVLNDRRGASFGTPGTMQPYTADGIMLGAAAIAGQ